MIETQSPAKSEGCLVKLPLPLPLHRSHGGLAKRRIYSRDSSQFLQHSQHASNTLRERTAGLGIATSQTDGRDFGDGLVLPEFVGPTEDYFVFAAVASDHEEVNWRGGGREAGVNGFGSRAFGPVDWFDYNGSWEVLVLFG